MKPFVAYTLARAGIFAAVYGLIWLIFGRSIGWSSISALYTALIAMVISSLIAFFSLRGLRDDFAVQVAQRAERAKAAFEARNTREDDDVEPGTGQQVD